ncbi:Dihydroneopterin triphosphate pyrophosphatase [Chromobacterium violaceum]|uniref:Dihydroneopterin triphosphate pyrophosphatase n=1 Tax=Chromobacterium violaceum TaxID=536 RepID=A0A3S4HJW9_CHRVL|nr:Dihydroneopterin triphosphate pyrophosphatase [Chromobacterium violaceum]
MGSKQPVSVLVVIHSRDGRALLMERADKPGYWQSVTGSREGDEDLMDTARREVAEETGLDASRFALSDWHIVNRYEIYEHWRHRYPEGVTHNDEHVFGLLLPSPARWRWRRASIWATAGCRGMRPPRWRSRRPTPRRCACCRKSWV